MYARKWQKGFYELHAAMREACVKFPQFMEVTQSLLYSNDLFLGRSSDNEEMVSYSDKEFNKYVPACRIKTTLGRFIKRRMQCDETSTYFTAAVVAALNGESTRFKILKGAAITQAYNDAIGGVSCMTGNYSEYTELYAANPDKVSMLVYINGEKTCRALLWKCNNGTLYMDRVYPDDDGQHIPIYHEWALRNGYDRRERQGAPSEHNGVATLENRDLSVTLDWASNGYFPYMDTFCWGDEVGVFRNYASNATRVYQQTSGGFSTTGIYCVCCEETYSEYNMHYVDSARGYICEDCYHEYYSTCSACEEIFITEDIECMDNGDRLCESCFSHHYTTCDVCDEYVRRDDVSETVDHSEVCSSCIDSDFTECAECGDYIHNDEIIETEGGEWLCKYCEALETEAA